MMPIKELRADGSDPLFDKTNMLYKEFPSDFRQIRYFTLLIVQSAPLEIKEINLLEQQIIDESSYWGNVVLLYFFLLVGAVPTIINMLKNQKKSGQTYSLDAEI